MNLYKLNRKNMAKGSPCGCLDSCGKPKKCYENESEAWECAKWLKGKERKLLKAYRCEMGVWHITHRFGIF